MKKICLLKWVTGSVDGGEKVAIQLSNELSNFYEVHLVSITSISPNLFFDIDDKVTYKNFISGKYKIKDVLFKGIRMLRQYCKENNIDIIFSIGLSANIFMIGATLGLKTKTVFCEHINIKYKLNGRLGEINRDIGVYFSDKVITLTKEDAENYLDYYGKRLKRSKVDSIYNWIELSDYRSVYNSNSKSIVTVGRFSQQKGYDLLGKVAVEVFKEFPDWKWDIYGLEDSIIAPRLIKYLEEKGVINNVNFKGLVSGTENIYPNHAMYVMTSIYEGLPLVLLEAKQYGLPVVSFSCPTGPSEIILDGVNGYLVPEYDVDKLSSKIRQLILNQSERVNFSKNSLIGCEKFSKEKILQRWVELIEELV
ncbi:glycosyltransferase family 4 protein [Streptococcus suis]